MLLARRILSLLAGVCFGLFAIAQTPDAKPLKIAVFAPVYLDSVFTNNNYRATGSALPKQVVPGLDFYNGVMTAIDSLNTEHLPITVLFYDTKSATNTLQKILAGQELKDVSLIIASFNTRSEIKPLADVALQMNIPLISSTYPNDGGISGNPFFVLINPTLKTHIEAIYRFLHKTYPTENMILFRKPGAIEDMIQYTLSDMNKRTQGVPLKIKTVELSDTFDIKEVTDNLDSTKQNFIICGSINEEFGSSLTKILATAKNYRSFIMGMPTWDGIRDISKDLEVIYTTPYNFLKNDKLVLNLATKYKAKYAGRPGEMFFKGYEAMFHFGKLLVKNKDGLINTLSDKDFKVFNDFDIQPVRSTKESSIPDYLENKKIYFVRKQDGLVKSIN